MASGTTLGTLVVMITFMAITIGLYGIAVTESPLFFAEGITGTGPSSTSSTNPSSLLALNITNVAILNVTNPSQEYDMTGWSWTRWRLVNTTTAEECFLIETFDDYGWFGDWNTQDLHWLVTNNNTEISKRLDVDYGLYSTSQIVMLLDDLDAIYTGPPVYPPVGPPSYPNRSMANLNFTLYNTDKGSIDITIAFNDSAYYTLYSAVYNEGIAFSAAQDFSDRRTSMNIISFIGSLFTFSPLGLPYPISTLFSFMWYGCVAALAYIVVAMVRSFIPLLTGE